MEAVKKYQEFKQLNPIKKDKWQPDALIIIPENVAALASDLKSTFHCKEVNSPSLAPGILVSNHPREVMAASLNSRTIMISEANEVIFQDLSELFLTRGTLARSFQQFSKKCEEAKVEYAAVAGACTYYYWGGWPIYDIDVVVPNTEQLNRLAAVYGAEVQESESGIGKMKYLNLGDIDALTDLELKYKDEKGETRRVFSYGELVGERTVGRLFGEPFPMASPDATVMLKLFLGRFGVDNWGIIKDDYEDGLGVLVDQNINFARIDELATKMGIQNRLELAKKIAQSVYQLGDRI